MSAYFLIEIIRLYILLHLKTVILLLSLLYFLLKITYSEKKQRNDKTLTTINEQVLRGRDGGGLFLSRYCIIKFYFIIAIYIYIFSNLTKKKNSLQNTPPPERYHQSLLSLTANSRATSTSVLYFLISHFHNNPFYMGSFPDYCTGTTLTMDNSDICCHVTALQVQTLGAWLRIQRGRWGGNLPSVR